MGWEGADLCLPRRSVGHQGLQAGWKGTKRAGDVRKSEARWGKDLVRRWDGPVGFQGDVKIGRLWAGLRHKCSKKASRADDKER